MTFNEAVEFKKTIGEIYQHGDVALQVLVIPTDEVGYNNYLANYRDNDFTDEDAKKYSLNNQFQVCGLKRANANVVVIPLSNP